MKKIVAWLLLAATMLSLCGCGAQSAPAETPTEALVETTVPETDPVIEETEPEVLPGSLFLTVGSITFSVVGESEDVYLGVIPRELVTWESEDPSIVSVENGVLTANAVGTTTIRATYFDRQVECTAGCLANTQEELDSLPWETLVAPKRLPPDMDLTEPCTYFDNAAIVGDSITYFLMQWDGKYDYLGNMTFLARGGVSMNGFARRFKNIYFAGKERNLEDAIAASGVERVYFLMGSNDIIAKTQRPYVYDNWHIILDRIKEVAPDVQIVLMSNIPLYSTQQEARQGTHEEYDNNIVEYNKNLRALGEEYGCLFLDLAQYVKDHKGRMPEMYSQGNYHMNEAGCLNWMKILRHYAQFESEGGSLS